MIGTIHKNTSGGPRLRVMEIQLFERDVTLRLPFRFGVITLTQAPQAFVRCRIQLDDGREGWGLSAEMLVPKWFDKNPDLSNDENLNHLRHALQLYGQALQDNGSRTAFGHYASLYHAHLKASAGARLNPLVASYGPALIDRAVMDALCRLQNMSFASAIRTDVAGICPQTLLPEFENFNMAEFMANLTPAEELQARHTVGMLDPLTAADQNTDDRINDGLPETLEEVIEAYGHTYFKLKLGGDLAADMERLKHIAAVLDTSSTPYKATLDGNEQYTDVDGVIELLAAMKNEPALDRLMASILFVEQPIHRDNALAQNVSPLAAFLPVIIDESDADLSVFERARSCGYAGVSSKNCKGFYKSLINLARCQMYTQSNGPAYFMSAEDLTCQAGVGVQQDLALVALLGLGHVERNGHHYVKGMAGAAEDEQSRFLAAHPDLYSRVEGRVCTKIANGKMSIASLQCEGFGTAVEPDWSSMREMPTV